MRFFKVPAGTLVRTIKVNDEWYSKSETTSRDTFFEVEDIRIDPMGHVGVGPQYFKTVGGVWAKLGYYGFKIMASPTSEVEWGTMLVYRGAVEVM